MKLRGQAEAMRRVLRRARQLRMHHALVVTGIRGAGKTTAVRSIAQAVLCPEMASVDDACGSCPECRAVAAGNHPDVHWVTVAEDKQDISVEQVRDVQEVMGRRPMQGRARVVLFDPADRLNEQGQNALLKTLEEPGADTFLLLPTSRPERLLGTVRSRADRLRLLPLDSDQLAAALAEAGVNSPAAALAVRNAGGSLGLAVELAAEGIELIHQHLVALIERPSEMSAISTARELLRDTEDRAAVDRRMRTVLVVARGVLRESLHAWVAQGIEAPYLADAYDSWASLFERLFEAESDLDLRMAPEQVLSHLLFGLQEELARRAASGSGSPG